MTRIVKRYENRKLYDTEDRRYISLMDIAKLIRQGIDIKVVDNKTGDDLTAQTLTQVILEEGKQGRPLLSKEALHSIIRFGNNLLDDVSEQLDSLIPDPIARLLGKNKPSELDELKQRVEQLEKLLQEVVQHTTQDNKRTKNTTTKSKEV